MNDLKRFRELLAYDSATGEIRWRVGRRGPGAKAGKLAGTITRYGYRAIMVDRKMYRSGRLAWLLFHGYWPRRVIDHINHIRTDDRIANLRDVASRSNNRNLSATRELPCGISREGGKYRARVKVNGKQYWSRIMPNITFALLWLAALRAQHDPA